MRKRKIPAIILALLVILQMSVFLGSFSWAGDEELPEAVTENTVAEEVSEVPAADPVPEETMPEAEGEVLPAEEAPALDAAPEEATTAEGPEVTEEASAAEEPEVTEEAPAAAEEEPAAAPAREIKTDPVPAAVDEDLTVYITNILYINPQIPASSVNGHAVAYTQSMTLVPGQSKNAAGFLNTAGGTNTNAGGLGADYKSLGVLAPNTADGGPILWETATDGKTIDRIYHDNNGDVRIRYKDGTIDNLGPVSEVYVSPAYKMTVNWYLIYNYIDNIANGDGSWSNQDFVTSFSHTFKDPSKYDTVNHFRFVNWKNFETEETYDAGETMTYTGAEQPSGTTKIINIYAMWQPSVTVQWHAAKVSQIEESEESFDQETGIGAYRYVPEDIITEDTTFTFEGWYDKEGNRVSEDTYYKAPEITAEKVEPPVYDLYPRYVTTKTVSKIWNDDNDRDGLRPDTLAVQLYRNGEALGDPAELSGDWTYTFTDLTALDENGEPYVYTVDETAVPEGYTEQEPVVTVLEDTLENVHEPELADITVTKVWDDGQDADGIRPDAVTMTLSGSDPEAEDISVTLTKDDAEDPDTWTCTIEDQYVYCGQGEKIEYTLTEDPVEGYTATIEGRSEEGFTVTNAHAVTPPDDDDPADDPSEEEPPAGEPGQKTPTGDETPLLMALLICAVSGLLLLVSGRKEDR